MSRVGEGSGYRNRPRREFCGPLYVWLMGLERESARVGGECACVVGGSLRMGFCFVGLDGRRRRVSEGVLSVSTSYINWE